MKSESPNDQNLILWKAVQKGDKASFDRLYRTHVQLLFKYGLSLGAEKELIKDAIQDLFTDLWRKKNTLQINSSFKNYLLLSLRRLIFQKNKSHLTVELDQGIENQSFELPQNFPDQTAHLEQKSERIKLAMQYLPKRQREAIFLKYFENLDYEEIAQVMSIQVGAVYKLVSVGIKKLREIV